MNGSEHGLTFGMGDWSVWFGGYHIRQKLKVSVKTVGVYRNKLQYNAKVMSLNQNPNATEQVTETDNECHISGSEHCFTFGLGDWTVNHRFDFVKYKSNFPEPKPKCYEASHRTNDECKTSHTLDQVKHKSFENLFVYSTKNATVSWATQWLCHLQAH